MSLIYWCHINGTQFAGRQGQRAGAYFYFRELLVELHAPIVYFLEPIVGFHAPIVYFPEPIIEFHAPIVYFPEPIVEFCAPIVYFTEPIAEFHAPIVYFPEPIVEIHAPIVYFTEPIVELHELYVYFNALFYLFLPGICFFLGNSRFMRCGKCFPLWNFFDYCGKKKTFEKKFSYNTLERIHL